MTEPVPWRQLHLAIADDGSVALAIAIERAAFLASWSGACGWKRARGVFLADLVVLESMRLVAFPFSRVAS